MLFFFVFIIPLYIERFINTKEMNKKKIYIYIYVICNVLSVKKVFYRRYIDVDNGGSLYSKS